MAWARIGVFWWDEVFCLDAQLDFSFFDSIGRYIGGYIGIVILPHATISRCCVSGLLGIELSPLCFDSTREVIAHSCIKVWVRSFRGDFEFFILHKRLGGF